MCFLISSQCRGLPAKPPVIVHGKSVQVVSVGEINGT
jgi:hypothetical protein